MLCWLSEFSIDLQSLSAMPGTVLKSFLVALWLKVLVNTCKYVILHAMHIHLTSDISFTVSLSFLSYDLCWMFHF